MNNKQSDNPIVATKLILSICFGYGLLMLCRTVVGVAGPAMLADPTLNIDTATFGAILGWGTAGNLMGKVTTGALADKLRSNYTIGQQPASNILLAGHVL